MQLIYRGVTYDYTPATTATTATTRAASAVKPKAVHPLYHLRYRGADYDVDPSVENIPAIFHPIAKLMYRGVTYSY